MPVTTTPAMILNLAYGRSKRNRPQSDLGAGEKIEVVARALRGLYAVAARVNPWVFASSAAVNFAAPGWARPANAEAILRVEKPDGSEVTVVPFDDRQAESGRPAVYEWGQIFRPAGNPNDPTSGQLTFYFATRPATPATLDTPLDALWIESYNALLELEVAIYLALKDGRFDEVGALKVDRDAWARLFIASCEHATPALRYRLTPTRAVTPPSLVSLGSLFAGGANLQEAA